MKNILLFAGTTEGRLLAEFLIHRPTAYGSGDILRCIPSAIGPFHDGFLP